MTTTLFAIASGASQMQLYLGANAKLQAIRFALCLLVGLASGIFALLYFRKSSTAERALTDCFATLAIGGIFVVCVEFFLDGKFEIYGAVAYILGCAIIPCVYKLIKRLKILRKSKSKE